MCVRERDRLGLIVVGEQVYAIACAKVCYLCA